MRRIPSTLVNVAWERIHMKITLSFEEAVPEGTRFFFCDSERVICAELDVVSSEENTVKLHLNITNNGLNRCIRSGTYKLYSTDGEEFYSIAGFDGHFETFGDWGRSFLYLDNKGTYSVSFLLDEYAEASEVQIQIYNAVNDTSGKYPGGFWKKIFEFDDFTEGPLEDNISISRSQIGVRKSSNTLIREGIRTIYRFSHRFLKLRGKQTILFYSEQNDTMPLNMQAILDRMMERGIDRQFHILTSLRRFTSRKYSTMSTALMVKKLGQADIIVLDDHAPVLDWLVLKDTKVIQVWHAGAGFKGVGYSRWGHHGCPGPYSAHRQDTFSISGSKPIAHFFSEQFGILDEQVIPTGMPRMDRYLDPENRARVTEALKKQYPQIVGREVILFAPTYRGRDRANAYYPYELIDFDALYALCEKKNAVVLFKMHPWVAEDVPIKPEHADRFLCVNSYPNINDLFYVSDLYITDYSSGMYEFSLMRKPQLFFAFDKVQYSASRGFHRDYDSVVPGKIVMTFEELLAAIESENYEFEKVEEYLKVHFDYTDTHNSDRVIDWLILGNLPEEYREPLERKQKQVSETIGKVLILEEESELDLK